MAGPFGARKQHFEVVDAGYGTACWRWLLCKQKNGYGKGNLLGKYGLAHRLYYEHHRGEIPAGMTIDHLCRNRDCVNPWHMEVVTPGENVRRGYGPVGLNVRKTHCPQGHPLSGENLLVVAGRNGRPCRRCRTCDRARRRAWGKRRLVKK